MSETLPKRIHGIEMEWGSLQVDDRNPTGRLVPVTNESMHPAINQYLLDTATPYSRRSNYAYLGNGARWYDDVHDHREYATPEENSFRSTVAHERVGSIMTRTVLDMHEQTTGRKTFLNKRVIDEEGQTWGYHENYCVHADQVAITAESLALLGLHLATRNIFFGAGSLDTDGHFWIAQKARDIDDSANASTTRNKPVINLRKEKLAGAEFNRVHVTSGDPNVSPWAIFVRPGSTSLVLRLIEDGETLDDMRLTVPLHAAMQAVAFDPTMSLPLENGRAVRAEDIQGRFIDAASDLSKRYLLPEEELLALEEWKHAHADYLQDPRLLKNRSDWVLKKLLLENAHDKKHIDWKSDKMRALEVSYDLVSNTTETIASRFRDRYWSAWEPSNAEIAARMGNGDAPSTTRANARGKFIKAFWQDRKHVVSDWQKVRYDRKDIPLPNPADPYSDKIEALIAQKQQLQTRLAGQSSTRLAS